MSLNIKKNIPLAPLTTFNIGGPARFFAEIGEKEDLLEAIKWAGENKHKYYILAGGSNVVINSEGIDGLVLKMNNRKMLIKGERIECGSGTQLSQVVNNAAGQNLTGLEWAIGIPGSMGGAVKGNAGAYGGSISSAVETVEVYNIENKIFEILSNRECQFRYRNSMLSNGKLIIWQINLRLRKGDPEQIKNRMNENIQARSKKNPNLPSAGSIFKNLTIEYLRECNEELAQMAEEEKAVRSGKVAAAWIIDHLGLKGKIIGGAKISLEHANFIVNTGNATAENVITLISFIKQQARAKIQVQLSEEVNYFGF